MTLPKNLSSFLLLPALVLTILSTGCQGNGETTSHQEFARLNLSSEPPSLDPRTAMDQTSAVILKMLFEGLTRLTPEGTPEPALAEKITLSNDGLTYTFHLRDSRWWDGEPVTAYDFQESWASLLDPAFASDFAYKLFLIKNGRAVKEGKLPLTALGVKVLDEKTLEVTLDHPTPYFLELLSTFFYFAAPRHIFKTYPRWAVEAGAHYVGNGPFKLVSWKHHNEIVVEKNPTYWDAEHVRLKGISLSMVEDASTELSLFEKGELDWAGKPLSISLPFDAIERLKKEGKLLTGPRAGVYMYLFNTLKQPFNSVSMRKALAYAIHRQAIIDNIVQTPEIAATSLIPPEIGFPFHSYFADGNLEEARQLFKEALEELHLTAEQLPLISLSYNTSEGHHKIAQAIQQQWFDAFGFRVALNNAEWKVYLDKINSGDYDMARLTWAAEVHDPLTFFEVFQQSHHHSGGWKNPSYDHLIEQSNLTSDPEERKRFLLKAEEILMEEMPFIPIYFNSMSYVKNPRLKGVAMTGLGNIDFRWAYFE